MTSVGPRLPKQATFANPRIRTYMAAHPCPLRVWLAPDASALVGTALQRWAADSGASLTHLIDTPRAPRSLVGPAVLLVSAKDILERNEAVQELAGRALPGRPIVIGGSRQRDVLLGAINAWHACRLVEPDLPTDALIDAINKAHHELSLEVALQRCTAELRGQCNRLENALAELRETQDRLVQRERLGVVGQLSGMVTKRLAEHLRAMEQLSSTLTPFVTNERMATFLRHAVEVTRSSSALLDDLLAVSEEREGLINLAPEPLDALVERSVSLFKLDPIAHKHRIELFTAANCLVRVDRHRLFHVVGNLIRNAVQASHPDQPITARSKREGDVAVIEIEDQGCGIPEALQRRIFAPFVSTKGNAGMGLGLRISRAAIERQGGQLGFASVEGMGTTFSIRLPVFEEHDSR